MQGLIVVSYKQSNTHTILVTDSYEQFDNLICQIIIYYPCLMLSVLLYAGEDTP